MRGTQLPGRAAPPPPAALVADALLPTVRFQLVFVVDVEFLPSMSLAQELLDAKALERLRSLASRGGVVVPAFEPLGRRAARSGLRGVQSLLEGEPPSRPPCLAAVLDHGAVGQAPLDTQPCVRAD
jgi:hypothetical protein